MNTITTVGIDLAKSTFSLHGVDAHGKTVLRKTLSRNMLLPFMAELPPCLVGMEACSGAHHWARELQKDGRPSMRYVPVKSAEQQAVLTLHRLGSGLVEDSTALINQLRGLLSEFGLVMPVGRYSTQAVLLQLLEDGSNNLPALARRLLADAWARLQAMNDQILAYDRDMEALILAAKNARVIWALLVKGTEYERYGLPPLELAA